MVAKDERGRFTKGNEGGPGRPKKEREQAYYDVLVSVVSTDDWKAIITRAIQDAKKGDPTARKFLADYLIGPPVVKNEISGKDGGALVIEYVNDWRKTS